MSDEERSKHAVPFTWINSGQFRRDLLSVLRELRDREHDKVQAFVDDEVATLNGKIKALQHEVDELSDSTMPCTRST